MAIKRPDIYENNNPAYSIADGDFVRGGFRTGVADLTALYALDPSPSAPDQFKEHATIVYVVNNKNCLCCYQQQQEHHRAHEAEK